VFYFGNLILGGGLGKLFTNFPFLKGFNTFLIKRVLRATREIYGKKIPDLGFKAKNLNFWGF